MPTVSVVIPTYNSAEYLPETLQSVLSQSYQDIEIIIIDDHSTDNTQQIIHELKSDKLRYIRLDTNHGGPSKPRNYGIAAAKGQYIVFFDSDDLMKKDRIASAVAFLDSTPELGLVFVDCVKFDIEKGDYANRRLHNYHHFHNLKKKKLSKNNYIIDSELAFTCLFFENFLIPSGVTVPKTVLKEVGSFDESLTNGDDRDMWFRISKKYRIGYIDTVGFRYRKREGAISQRGIQLAENRIRVLEKQLAGQLPHIARKGAINLIADNFYGIGYQLYLQGKKKQARHYYFYSLLKSLTWKALKGVIRTFLPR